MAGGLQKRKSQVAVELEATEGTAETLVAADAAFYAYDPTYSLDPQMFQRQPARAYLGQLKGIVGKQTGTISWGCEVKGSGSVATQPAWRDSLVACGFTGVAVSAISGTGGGGTFIPGETITGLTGATGRVVGEWAASGGAVKYVATSTTALQNGTTIEGSTSGASFTSNATPLANRGFEYRPDDDAKAATVGLYMDGTLLELKGCRGNVRVEGNVGEPQFFRFTMDGVVSEITDASLLSPTYESTEPPAFLSAGFSIHGNGAMFTTVSMDMQNERSQREDANESKGVKSYLITGRAPQISVNPEATLNADYRFRNSLLDETTGRSFWKVGTVETNRVMFGFPKVQYTGAGDGDRAGMAVTDLTVDVLTLDEDTGDDEVQIAAV